MKKIKFYQALTSMCLGILSCSAAELYSIDNLLNEVNLIDDYQITSAVSKLQVVIHAQKASMQPVAQNDVIAQVISEMRSFSKVQPLAQNDAVDQADFVLPDLPTLPEPVRINDERAIRDQAILAAYPNLTPDVVASILKIFPNGYDFTALNNLYGLIEKAPTKLLVFSGKGDGFITEDNDIFKLCGKSFAGMSKKEKGSISLACRCLNPRANLADGSALCSCFFGNEEGIMTVRGMVKALNLLDPTLFPRYNRAFRYEKVLKLAISSFGGNLMTLKNWITRENMPLGPELKCGVATIYRLCGIPLLLSQIRTPLSYSFNGGIAQVGVPTNIDTFNSWAIQALVIDQVLLQNKEIKIQDKAIGDYIRDLRKEHGLPLNVA